jgi:hypothetical protein
MLSSSLPTDASRDRLGRPAAMVALLDGTDYAAVVQRNHIGGRDLAARQFTAVTLARAKEGRIVELQYLVSDQYAVDDLWSSKL